MSGGVVLRGAGVTDTGLVRAANEDAFLVDEARALFAVADGMGGHRAGGVASTTAIDALARSLVARTIWALVAGVRDANEAVLDASMADPELRGMGTTLCALGLVTDESGAERLGVVNVGDSRVYVFTGGRLVQISEDHSLVEEMLRGGRITEEEAEHHPRRNVLTRALGVEPGVLVDGWYLEAAAGDRLLLCSDGLVNEVDEGAIAATLAASSGPEAAATALVQLALEGGGRDNVTCVVVDVEEAPEPGAPELESRVVRVETDPRAPDDDPAFLAMLDDESPERDDADSEPGTEVTAPDSAYPDSAYPDSAYPGSAGPGEPVPGTDDRRLGRPSALLPVVVAVVVVIAIVIAAVLLLR